MAFYAWSEIRNGGEVEEIKLATGATRRIVSKRNIIEPGAKITKANSGLSGEEWDRMVDHGVIREYPFPEGTNEYTSPSQAVLKQLSVGGEVPVDTLLALAAPKGAEGEAE